VKHDNDESEDDTIPSYLASLDTADSDFKWVLDAYLLPVLVGLRCDPTYVNTAITTDEARRELGVLGQEFRAGDLYRNVAEDIEQILSNLDESAHDKTSLGLIQARRVYNILEERVRDYELSESSSTIGNSPNLFIDDGEMDLINGVNAFVLGFEYCRIWHKASQDSAKRLGENIRSENRDRIHALCKTLGYSVYLSDTSSTGWVRLHAYRFRP